MLHVDTRKFKETRDPGSAARWTILKNKQTNWFVSIYNGILVPVRTSFVLRRCGGKTYNVSM